jgi:hypothetical protein
MGAVAGAVWELWQGLPATVRATFPDDADIERELAWRGFEVTAPRRLSFLGFGLSLGTLGASINAATEAEVSAAVSDALQASMEPPVQIEVSFAFPQGRDSCVLVPSTDGLALGLGAGGRLAAVCERLPALAEQCGLAVQPV